MISSGIIWEFNPCLWHCPFPYCSLMFQCHVFIRTYCTSSWSIGVGVSFPLVVELGVLLAEKLEQVSVIFGMILQLYQTWSLCACVRVCVLTWSI